MRYVTLAALALVTALKPATAVDAGGGLEQSFNPSNKTLETTRLTYRGKSAVKVLDSGAENSDPLIVLPVKDFANGVIEAEVAGLPSQGAPPEMRGFIGIAFRIQADPKRHEVFYVRPTNGRADDQLRRNHATQYEGMPEYPWFRLRKENPGVYESYADMVAGEWTRLRIEVDGGKARLFVNGAAQPSLIVNDLKLGPNAKGGVALWIGNWTEGYFSNVRVTPRA